MKILHLCKKYPPALGGDTVVVSNLERQQVARGHEVAIFTSRLAELDDRPQLHTFGFSETGAQLDNITLRRLVSLLMLAVKSFVILRRERPDIIHSHSVDMAFFASFAARIYRIPMIHTFHIVTFYDENQSWFRRKTELWLARGAGLWRVTAPNSYDVAQLRAAGLRQAMLLPNGVDVDYWRVEAAEPNQEFLFVAVGRLEAQKGYEFLVRAAQILAANVPNFRVIVAGEGSQDLHLQTLANELGVADKVEFVGRKSAEATRELLAQADAVVQPSLYETTPLTLLEAWAAGKPVIATPVGILRETSADFAAAHIVPIKNERALARAMQHLVEEAEDRQRMARQAQAEVQQYNWPKIARTAERIYQGDV